MQERVKLDIAASPFIAARIDENRRSPDGRCIAGWQNIQGRFRVVIVGILKGGGRAVRQLQPDDWERIRSNQFQVVYCHVGPIVQRSFLARFPVFGLML